MPNLYVTEAGTQVRKIGDRLLICKGKEVLEEIPLIKVDQVVMMGRGVSLTTAAVHALTRRGVEVVFLTGAGRYVSRLVGSEHKHSQLRQTQALVVTNPAAALALAKSIVSGKIENQRVLVRRHAEGASWMQPALDGIQGMADRVDGARVLDELRGLEGQAAKGYFGLMRQMLARPLGGGSWGFERRAYYPPPDPINALLSFGYTLLLNDMVTACELIGLDPYLGCFHAVDYGRPSMALDLIEEFRPVIVDSLVLAAVNHSQIRLEDFRALPGAGEPGDEEEEEDQPAARGDAQVKPILMRPEARAKYLSWYEQRVNEQAFYPRTQERTSYRRILGLQAELMARVILGQSKEYVPFTVK